MTEQNHAHNHEMVDSLIKENIDLSSEVSELMNEMTRRDVEFKTSMDKAWV